MTLTHGELFAGISGFGLGFGRAGIATRWHVEIDRDARRVLGQHYPDADHYADVEKVSGGLRHCNAENGILAETEECLGGVSPPRGATPELEVLMREKSTSSRLGFHYKKLSPEQAIEAVVLYDAGQSVGQVAEHFGVTRQGMWDILRRRTTMRPQLRHGAENHFYRGGVTSDADAHDALEDALRRGEMVRPTVCEECGQSGTAKDGRSLIQAHHDDYNKPLAVRWLCQSCHHDWHKHNTATRKEVQAELSPVDVITAGFP